MELAARTGAWNKSIGGIRFLDYATSKDGSYFDTGVYIHQRPDAFELKIRLNSVRPDIGQAYDGIFGARNNYIYQVRAAKYQFEFYDSVGHYCSYDIATLGEWTIIRVDTASRRIYFNDYYNYTNDTDSDRYVTLNNTAWLGDVNMTGMSWKNVPADFDCAYLKLYTNKTWSHEYLPAIVDGVVGFYETNSRTFHPSEGTAPFIAGPDKTT